MFSLCTLHFKTKQKNRGFHKKNLRIFKTLKNLMEIEFCWRQIFVILISHKPSLVSNEVPQKIGQDRFNQKGKQTVYMYINRIER